MGELIGYARCSTEFHDLTAQTEILTGLGVHDDRIYLDKGLTGTNRERLGLDQAPAAVRAGDTLVVREVRLSLGGSIYDPADPMSTMFFNMRAVFAEFEADLLKMRTRGKLKGRAPKLTARQQAELVRMHGTGDHTIAELMEVSLLGGRRCIGRWSGFVMRPDEFRQFRPQGARPRLAVWAARIGASLLCTALPADRFPGDAEFPAGQSRAVPHR
ncbi:recombinase family protein [Actinomadura sp. NEAU-AAG7]|uniref:recombinase family protein n=1 Tax=Actinomadura sp. NEAU-AAG7 TaxID=2839640 RepID=UPI0027DEC394|nr:recombinase family protein [Actinomadura sp. NEAU-AAG7]